MYNIEFQTSCRPKYMAAGVQFPFRMNSKVRALYFLLRYESSTLILYKELSSPIFQM